MLASIPSTLKTPRSPWRRNFVPYVEALESRWQPAVTTFSPVLLSPDMNFVPGQFGGRDAMDQTGPQTGDRTSSTTTPAIIAAFETAAAFPPSPQAINQPVPDFVRNRDNILNQQPPVTDRPVISNGMDSTTMPTTRSRAYINRLTANFGVIVRLPEASDRQRPENESRRIMYGAQQPQDEEVRPEDQRQLRTLDPNEAPPRVNGQPPDHSAAPRGDD